MIRLRVFNKGDIVMLGLITLIMLGAFSLLYISKSIATKPDFINKILKFITDNIEMIALIGVIYGIVAAILTPIASLSSTEMLIRFIANLLLVVLALPYTFDRLVVKYGHKMNSAITEEVRALINRITGLEKIFGIIGCVVTVLLFAVLFR